LLYMRSNAAPLLYTLVRTMIRPSENDDLPKRERRICPSKNDEFALSFSLERIVVLARANSSFSLGRIRRLYDLFTYMTCLHI
jgi:hypothetical protein